MIDHVGVDSADLDRSVAFYEQALAPLGYKLIMRFPEAAGFGMAGKPDFWVGKASGPVTNRTHIAFRVDRRSIVKAFHAAAVAAGGTDNGPPGVRPHYHEHYFGAFVRDPDGHNVEAVCHEAYLG